MKRFTSRIARSELAATFTLFSIAISCATGNGADFTLNPSHESATSTTFRIESAITSFGLEDRFDPELQFDQNQSAFNTDRGDRFARWVLIPPQGGVEIFTLEITSTIVESPDHSETETYPSEFAELGTPAIMRGYRMVPIYLSNLIRDVKTGEVRKLSGGEITLRFDTSRNRTNQVADPSRKKSSQFAMKLVKNMVVNPELLERDEGVEAGSILYVMRDRDDIEEHLEPLIEWRRRMGWTVISVRVAQNESREAVKAAIQDVYDEAEYPPDYVVLVGDAPTQGDDGYSIAYYNIQNGANFPYESDQQFVLLEGNDLLPDAAIGRISFGSLNAMDRAVNKTIRYESTPFIGDNDNNRGWQQKAIVAATDGRSGKSSVDVCKWFRDLLLANDYQQVNQFYYSPNQQQPNPTEFIQSNTNNGVSFILYRGWSDMNGYEPTDATQLRNGGALPFVMLATCNTGEYVTGNQNDANTYTEKFITNSLGGGIGAVGAAGATHTAYNNLLAAGTLSAPFLNGIYSQGWALQNGKLQLMKAYQGLGDINHEENRNMEAWLTEYYIFNLMGDPAVDLFTAIPKRLNVTHPATLNIGDTHFEVIVTSEGDDTPVADARVCLYVADGFQISGFTAEDGIVDLFLEPGWITDETVKLTVSGHNLLTMLEDVEAGQAAVQISYNSAQISDDNNGNSRGNGDGDINPTERIELSVRLTNRGQDNPQGQMRVSLIPESDLIRVVSNAVMLDSAPRRGQTVTVLFIVDVTGGFPNGSEAAFKVSAEINRIVYESYFNLPVIGPQVDFASIQWSGNPLPVGGNGTFWLTLRNNGVGAVSDLTGELISLSSTISIVSGETSFHTIEAGDSQQSDGVLGVTAAENHIAGNLAQMALVVRTEAGFIDTAFFSLRVGRSLPSTPFGPDDYGYICIDDSDTGWVNRPAYNWVEISSRLGGSGSNLRLSDNEEEADTSVVVDLPFDFRYYGEDFQQITICSNGWASFGDHHEMKGARNRRIPSGEILPAMLAPFWDDLILTQDGGVYHWYDGLNARYIIEWSRMRKLGPQGNGEPLETFQIILFDPELRAGEFGDGEIKFQYLDVADVQSCFQTWDTPFATIGIGSPSRDTGLEYSYWNQLHTGAASLRDGLAILFTTEALNPKVYFAGVVTNAATNRPIPNAEVAINGGQSTFTDAIGQFLIGIGYYGQDISITTNAQFYNDSTRSNLDPAPGDTTEVNFGLFKPIFSINKNSLVVEALDVGLLEDSLVVHNTGLGKLFFSCSISEANPRPMELIEKHETLLAGTDSDWLTFAPLSDTLLAGEAGVIHLEVDPSSLDSGLYEIDLVITHNAEPGFIEIPVELSVLLSVDNSLEIVPNELKFVSAYPNPFNSFVKISYSIPAPSYVRVAIYDVSGQSIAELFSGKADKGRKNSFWDATNAPAGVYICRVMSSDKVATTKLLLIK